MKAGKYLKKKKRAPVWCYVLLILLIGVVIGCGW